VSIPEGEIEDLGTVFSVTVHGGHTTRIAVTQGAVVLRRVGLPELHLGTGSVWERVSNAEVEAAPVPPPAAPRSLPVTSVDTEKLAPPPPSAAHVARKISAHTKPALAALPQSTPEPTDEDSTYLELIRLVREHRTEDVQRVASDYLKRFPDGFRHQDVERVAQAVTPHE
jgi:hypothetical protein